MAVHILNLVEQTVVSRQHVFWHLDFALFADGADVWTVSLSVVLVGLTTFKSFTTLE